MKSAFVGTKKQAREIFQTNAGKSSQPYVVHDGLAECSQITKQLRVLFQELQIEQMDDDGSLSKLPKKRFHLLKELYKLEKNLTGISDGKTRRLVCC